LDAVGGFVAENEDISRKRITAEPFADHGGQGVERFPQIRRLRREVNADARGQAQHEGPLASRRSTSVTRVWGSKPGPTRRHRPLARTTSMPRVAGSPADSGTTCTGRKAGSGGLGSTWRSFRRHQ